MRQPTHNWFYTRKRRYSKDQQALDLALQDEDLEVLLSIYLFPKIISSSIWNLLQGHVGHFLLLGILGIHELSHSWWIIVVLWKSYSWDTCLVICARNTAPHTTLNIHTSLPSWWSSTVSVPCCTLLLLLALCCTSFLQSSSIVVECLSAVICFIIVAPLYILWGVTN